MLPSERNELRLPALDAPPDNWSLSYCHSTGTDGPFPIGFIGDKATPADAARETINRQLGHQFGPIVHVALAHDLHNGVEVMRRKPTEHKVYNCDAIIFRKEWRIAVGTLLGDCTCIVVTGLEHIGFIHAGRPELWDGIVQRFAEAWVIYEMTEMTDIMVGPGICGTHYELPDVRKVVGTGLEQFTTETVWKTQGYDVTAALEWQLKKLGFSRQIRLRDRAGICPYCENAAGRGTWASDRYFRRQDRKSPRDLALLHHWE